MWLLKSFQWTNCNQNTTQLHPVNVAHMKHINKKASMRRTNERADILQQWAHKSAATDPKTSIRTRSGYPGINLTDYNHIDMCLWSRKPEIQKNQYNCRMLTLMTERVRDVWVGPADLTVALSSPFRVFRPWFPKADAFPGAPRPNPEEDDAQTEAAPGETQNATVTVNNATRAEWQRSRECWSVLSWNHK